MAALTGKVIVVTGSTLGAGAAAVRTLVGAGARIFVVEENIGRLVALIAELGHNSLDGTISETRSIETFRRASAQAERRFGPVDAAVHAFPLLPPVSPENDPEVLNLSRDFERAIALEVLAAMECFSGQSRPGAVLALTNWPPGEVSPPEELRSSTLLFFGELVRTLAGRPDARDLRVNLLTVLGPGDAAARGFRARFAPDSADDPTRTFHLALEYLLTEPVSGMFVEVEAEL